MNCFIPKPSPKGLGGFGHTKCQTHLAKFQDINTMVSRALSGDTSVFRNGGVYADLTKAPESMQEALNAQRSALEAYNQLPDNVRSMYPSPQAFYAASLDPDNRETFKKLGLLLPEEVESSPVKVEVVNSQSEKTSTLDG